ncbi:hypothetical protein [Streptomyces sp. NPDC018000]|uniref:hypothetical protein n=1 Tax=Streptomyces sp. NPDC018000 TaxID=3365028 RepID=UPI00378B73CE
MSDTDLHTLTGAHALHAPHALPVTVLDEVALEHPPVEGSGEACLRAIKRHPCELPPGAALFPVQCGERVH